MIGVILIGLAILGFALYLGSLFFQIHSMERRLDEAIRDAEIYLLKEFGEASTDRILASKGQKVGSDYDEDDE